MKGYAICKDCGNGTMDNELNEQFILAAAARTKSSIRCPAISITWAATDDYNETVVCKDCGSDHIDGELEAA